MTLADVAAIKVKATKHHNEIKRMNALKSKAKSKKASDKVRRTWDARRRKSRDGRSYPEFLILRF